MKRVIISFLIIFLLGAGVRGQSPIDKFFDKYMGQDGFTTVVISKEMFQMFKGMKTDNDNKAIGEIMNQLEGLKVVAFDRDSSNKYTVSQLYSEALAAIPFGTYKVLMQVKEKDQDVTFYAKDGPKGKLSELLMLMKSGKEMAALSITGLIDLSTVSELSKSMNFKGMDKLNKLKEKK
ncbi:MAG: DUF4252 domain-containing protein [Bacteroidetes bacterium]|nr:DUF4252 domain-containing protein [Bacteroidota bacterium]